MSRKHPEILAPAGSMETLSAALRTGADAVYVGGKSYSARSSASNFTADELKEAADKCHLYGARLYLAVNTVISDDELADFCGFIKAAAEAGVDAFIVQDYGALHIIRNAVPDAVLHASTQMTIHTPYGARLAKSLGFSRLVPARELDVNTLKAVCSEDIETEIFVHGALCMSVSGQCYMSAVIGSRSANRGRCGQACRLPFSSCGGCDSRALSLKDLSLIPVISRTHEIGADSLKIEGRMKRPEYVASAVSEIRNAFEGKKPDMALLRSIFSRGGFTDGYFTGKRRDMFGIREKEDVLSSHEAIPKIHELYRSERKCRTLDFHAVIRENEDVTVTARCGDISVRAVSLPPEKALKRPADTEYLKKQLSRLGDTVYSMGTLTAEIGEGLTVPAGRLNEIRRTLCTFMDNALINAEKPQYTITGYVPDTGKAPEKRGAAPLPVHTVCRSVVQAKAAYGLSEYIIVPVELLSDEFFDTADKGRIIVSPPRFIVNAEETLSRLEILREKGYTHLLCHTPDSIALGKEAGYILHGGFGLNVFNSLSIKELSTLGLCDITASFEAKITQINRLCSDIPLGGVIYGRLPLMLARNCPIRNETGCGKCSGRLTDRTGRDFPVVCTKDYCEILNSDILYMADRLSQLETLSFGIVLLHDEDEAQTLSAIRGIKPKGNITRGLYTRGID